MRNSRLDRVGMREEGCPTENECCKKLENCMERRTYGSRYVVGGDFRTGIALTISGSSGRARKRARKRARQTDQARRVKDETAVMILN